VSFIDIGLHADIPDKIEFQWVATQRKAAAEVIPPTLESLKMNAPFSALHPDAGRLRRSIGWRTYTYPRRLVLQFVSTAPYAKYVIEGTKGGQTIVPKVTSALRWRGGMAPGSNYSFASSVIRGATEANDFNVRVAIEMTPFIRKAFKDAFVIVIK